MTDKESSAKKPLYSLKEDLDGILQEPPKLDEDLRIRYNQVHGLANTDGLDSMKGTDSEDAVIALDKVQGNSSLFTLPYLTDP